MKFFKVAILAIAFIGCVQTFAQSVGEGNVQQVAADSEEQRRAENAARAAEINQQMGSLGEQIANTEHWLKQAREAAAIDLAAKRKAYDTWTEESGLPQPPKPLDSVEDYPGVKQYREELDSLNTKKTDLTKELATLNAGSRPDPHATAREQGKAAAEAAAAEERVQEATDAVDTAKQADVAAKDQATKALEAKKQKERANAMQEFMDKNAWAHSLPNIPSDEILLFTKKEVDASGGSNTVIVNANKGIFGENIFNVLDLILSQTIAGWAKVVAALMVMWAIIMEMKKNVLKFDHQSVISFLLSLSLFVAFLPASDALARYFKGLLMNDVASTISSPDFTRKLTDTTIGPEAGLDSAAKNVKARYEKIVARNGRNYAGRAIELFFWAREDKFTDPLIPHAFLELTSFTQEAQEINLSEVELFAGASLQKINAAIHAFTSPYDRACAVFSLNHLRYKLLDKRLQAAVAEKRKTDPNYALPAETAAYLNMLYESLSQLQKAIKVAQATGNQAILTKDEMPAVGQGFSMSSKTENKPLPESKYLQDLNSVQDANQYITNNGLLTPAAGQSGSSEGGISLFDGFNLISLFIMKITMLFFFAGCWIIRFLALSLVGVGAVILGLFMMAMETIALFCAELEFHMALPLLPIMLAGWFLNVNKSMAQGIRNSILSVIIQMGLIVIVSNIGLALFDTLLFRTYFFFFNSNNGFSVLWQVGLTTITMELLVSVGTAIISAVGAAVIFKVFGIAFLGLLYWLYFKLPPQMMNIIGLKDTTNIGQSLGQTAWAGATALNGAFGQKRQEMSAANNSGGGSGGGGSGGGGSGGGKKPPSLLGATKEGLSNFGKNTTAGKAASSVGRLAGKGLSKAGSSYRNTKAAAMKFTRRTPGGATMLRSFNSGSKGLLKATGTQKAVAAIDNWGSRK